MRTSTRWRVALACAAAALVGLPAAPPATAAPFRPLTGIKVEPSRGAVSVVWYHDVHRRAVGYRVTAVSQQLQPGRRPPPRIVVAPPTRGNSATAVFTGLRPGTSYVIWIEVIGKRTHSPGFYYEQMFSSPGVRPL